MKCGMSDQSLNIRPLATLEEFKQTEALQAQVWGMQDLTAIVPIHVTVTAQKNGGLVAGAFDPHGVMIGFVFGFLGFGEGGKLKHCSHMLGVLPEVRRQNVGYQLKLFQRRYVLKQELDLITWTYDPLEGVNASLNIAKLGVFARKYYHNLYGAWSDDLNRGLPTDRFEVEWWINSPRVRDLLVKPQTRPSYAELLRTGARPVFEVRFDDAGAIHAVAARLDLDADTLLVEIPAEFQAIKLVSLDLARVWRQQTGSVFSTYFSLGYTVTDFLSERIDMRRRNFYVLRRELPGPALR